MPSATSGMPATLVSTLTTPATTALDTTICQSTAEMTAPVPITATAVCAIVLTARIPAAFNHFFVSTDTFNIAILKHTRFLLYMPIWEKTNPTVTLITAVRTYPTTFLHISPSRAFQLFQPGFLPWTGSVPSAPRTGQDSAHWQLVPQSA